MFTTSFFLALATVSGLVSARPASLEARTYPRPGTACDISQAKLVFPQDLANLTAQTEPTSFVGFAFGVQNYTCADGHYKSDGVIARLFDASCLIANDPHGFSELPSKALEIWKQAPPEITIDKVNSAPGLFTSSQFQGDYFFFPNPNQGEQPPIIPRWDFSAIGGAFSGNLDAGVTGKAKATVAAPTGPQDVNWSQFDNAENSGKLGKQIYRTDTREGQPPPTCSDNGSKLSVKFTCNYWFMGASL